MTSRLERDRDKKRACSCVSRHEIDGSDFLIGLRILPCSTVKVNVALLASNALIAPFPGHDGARCQRRRTRRTPPVDHVLTVDDGKIGLRGVGILDDDVANLISVAYAIAGTVQNVKLPAEKLHGNVAHG